MERVDRNDPYYKACLVGSTGIGAYAGNVVGAVGAPVSGGLSLATLPWGGIALGFAVGYLACPYLVPMVRPKIENNFPMDEFAINQAMRAMSQYAGVMNSSEAVKLLALVRTMPKQKTKAVACTSPKLTAQTLLAKMS